MIQNKQSDRAKLPRTKENLIAMYKRQYAKQLKDLTLSIALEIESVNDKTFEPTTATQHQLINLLKTGERLTALLELEN